MVRTGTILKRLVLWALAQRGKQIEIPILRIRQSLADKGVRRSSAAEFNDEGRIRSDAVLVALTQGGAVDNEICLERSCMEREPNDREVIDQIAESVVFCAPYIDSGMQDLNI